jgi:hypothetical protein
MISPGTRVAVAAAVASLASFVSAQETPFRSRSDLVIVSTTVTDRTGRFVRGLTAADFEILEDGGRRPVAQFTAQRVPVSVAILLDISGSMLEAAVARVADDLRDQYTLGFEPANTDGEFHKIAVKTRGTEHRVRGRRGYVAEARR